MTAPVPDPNDTREYTVQRWEPFILGLIANCINDPAAVVIGLQMVRATPDEVVPFMIVHTEAKFEERARHYYRITVAHIDLPPDTEGT